MRLFFGVISPRSFSSTCWRRQRLRSAIATARLAACLADDVAVELGDDLLGRHRACWLHASISIVWCWLV